MPLFKKGPDYTRTPFGKNEFRRSTQDIKTESYTCAATGHPVEVIDGHNQKVLQPGTVMCKITSGADAGKIGAFDSGATDGRQTIANFVGFDVTFLPWQLLEGDREVSVAYDVSVVQGWCFEFVAGVRTALTNATRDAILALPQARNITFH